MKTAASDQPRTEMQGEPLKPLVKLQHLIIFNSS